MRFRITGLDAGPFLPLYGLSDEALAAQGVRRLRADEPHSFPDRIELRDAEPGETVLLLNHTYLDVPTPYRGTHAIFVREGAIERYDAVDEVPDALRRRLLSARAFDEAGMMVDADVVDVRELEGLLEKLFAHPQAAYVQLHHARRGCYAARVERA